MSEELECPMCHHTNKPEAFANSIDKMLKKPVGERSNEEHQKLIEHFGGVRQYLRSMGAFKEVDINED